jgi:parvulin-like peptidyl-prolyl isomerase
MRINMVMRNLDERMRCRQTLMVMLTLTLMALPLGAQGDDDPVIAEVRGATVTLSQWNAHLEASPRLAATAGLAAEQARSVVEREVLGMLGRQLDLNEIDERGLADLPETAIRVAAAERSLLAQWARSEGLPAEIEISDEALDEALEERSDELNAPPAVRFQQIYLSLRDLSEDEAEAKRELAEEIDAQLREDPSLFGELMEAHSDSEIRDSSAILGPINPEQTHEAVVEVLWALEEGEVSGPLETPFGIHFFKLSSFISRSLNPSQARVQVRADLVREAMEARIGEIVADAEALDLQLPPAPEALAEDTVIVGGAIEVTGADLALLHEFDLASPSDTETLAQLIAATQEAATLAAMARAEGWDQEPQISEALESARQRTLIQMLWEQRLEEDQPITDELVRSTYEEGLENYAQPRRVRVREIEIRPARRAESGQSFALLDVLEHAESLRDRLAAGEDFGEIAREHSTSDDVEADLDPHWVYPFGADSGRFETLAEIATGEISEPIPLRDGYVLAEAIAVEENIHATFEQVERDIRRRLLRARQRRVGNAWNEAIQQEVVFSLPDDVILRHTAIAEEEAPASPEESL